MGRVYTGSSKIRVRCILGSGKIRVGCISILRISDQLNGFRALFLGYFFFCQNKKTRHIYYLKLFIFIDKHLNCNLLKEYHTYSKFSI